MTRIKNSEEFGERLGQILRNANRVKAILNIGIEIKTETQEVESDAAEVRKREWLECHARNFIIDHILAALNWSFAPQNDPESYIQANMVIEQSLNPTDLEKTEGEKRKRLDYFGFERDTQRPLLIVEAKRPSVNLPGLMGPSLVPQGHPLATLFANYLNKSRNADPQKNFKNMTAEWQEHLSQLRNYARGLAGESNTWPKRLVMSNGGWLIIFLDPEAAFSGEDSKSSDGNTILVFETWDIILEHFRLIWSNLEYENVSKTRNRFEAAELPFFVDASLVEAAIFAVRLVYTSVTGANFAFPNFSVSPELILQSTRHSFINVFTRWQANIPPGDNEINGHIEEMTAAADRLKSDVEMALRCSPIALRQIEEHVGNEYAIKILPAVQRLSRLDDADTVLLLLTGSQKHFFNTSHNFVGCKFHSHKSSVTLQTAQLLYAIAQPSIEHKSYFTDGSVLHCTHRAVYTIKSQDVTEDNKHLCGPRSGGAFCELWPCEKLLCCRSCVYQNVCSASSVFNLPCDAPVEDLQ